MKLGSRALSRRVGYVLTALLALGPAVVASAPAAQASYRPSSATVAAYEARVIYRINQQRVAYHRAKLSGTYSSARCPDGYAERYAPVMANRILVQRRAFDMSLHQNMYTILAGCRASVAAENLAMGNVGADAVVAAWMRSPGHRANILNSRLNRIGVAAVYAGGRWFVVADFTRA